MLTIFINYSFKKDNIFKNNKKIIAKNKNVNSQLIIKYKWALNPELALHPQPVILVYTRKL